MSLQIASLNSGSNGNCYYIGTTGVAILVDAGLSCRETEKRMLRLGLEMEKVQAIFISHEHSDHIRGLEVLSRKYRLPVYITPATHKSSRLFLQEDLLRDFRASEKVSVGDLEVLPFSKYHDAADPHSFVVSGAGVNVGVFTDLGRVCRELTHYFSHCDAAFLETNYDEQLLATGSYPVYLKRRISGGEGHLSNTQALELFRKHKSERLRHVLLSHLSRDNNDPNLALSLFSDIAGTTKVTVASRDKESDVFTIAAGTAEYSPIRPRVEPAQMNLFQELLS